MSDPEKPSTDYRLFEATCSQSSGSLRPDKYLTEVFDTLNRSEIQRAVQNGLVKLNGNPIRKKQSFTPGDLVTIEIEAEKSLIPFPVNLPLDVVYEDEAIIVVNKAPGMVTHPGSGTGDDTLCHALLHHCNGELSRLNGEDRPGIVHRLDKDTSGLLVAAKTDEALSALIETFKERSEGLEKWYLALCCGVPSMMSGVELGAIGRDQRNRVKMAVVEDGVGREAHTEWQLSKSHDRISLIECKILTGRTHQIRVHLSHLGHPIIGDSLYGYHCNLHERVKLKANRPLLHAWKLKFSHPVTGEKMEFEQSAPDDFDKWCKLFTEN